jgi:hypothetical protein
MLIERGRALARRAADPGESETCGSLDGARIALTGQVTGLSYLESLATRSPGIWLATGRTLGVGSQ